MPVNFVYFDLGNVLLRFDNRKACRQMAERTGVPVEVMCAFFEAGDYAARLESGTVSAEQVHSDFCREHNTRCSIDELKRAGSDMFQVNQAIVPLVTRLVVAGIPVGVLSNTSATHWEFVTDGRFRFLNDLFDTYALSFQIGAMKPAAAIYQEAAELAGCEPESIFFTDDRPENVDAARVAGWHAMPYRTVHQLANDLREAGLKFWY